MTGKGHSTASRGAENFLKPTSQKPRQRLEPTKPEKPDTFMNLLPELRNMIFELVSRPETFELEAEKQQPTFGVKVVEIRPSGSVRARKKSCYLPSLASTSKTIRREFLPIWYSMNVIIFRSPSTDLQAPLDWLAWVVEDFTRLGMQKSLCAVNFQLDMTKSRWSHERLWRPAAHIARLCCDHEIPVRLPLHQMSPPKLDSWSPGCGLLAVSYLGVLAHREKWEPQQFEHYLHMCQTARRRQDVERSIHESLTALFLTLRNPPASNCYGQHYEVHLVKGKPSGWLVVCKDKISRPVFGMMSDACLAA